MQLSNEEIIDFGLKNGSLRLDPSGEVRLTDKGDMEAIEYLGGRDVLHLTAALYAKLYNKWSVAGISEDTIYFIIQNTVKEIAEIARESDWNSTVKSFEDLYLEPVGYFNTRSRAVLNIG